MFVCFFEYVPRSSKWSSSSQEVDFVSFEGGGCQCQPKNLPGIDVFSRDNSCYTNLRPVTFYYEYGEFELRDREAEFEKKVGLRESSFFIDPHVQMVIHYTPFLLLDLFEYVDV